MDQELKDYLDQRFDAVDRRFEALDHKIDTAQTSMFQRMDEIAAALEEGYRDTQTEVLKAVHSMGERL
jgi:hypothetical protein